MTYLDNNATTRVDPDVVEAMRRYFVESFANPSSVHAFGQSTYEEMQKVRALIADKLKCDLNEIIFTSSGSEANNLCLKGFVLANRNRGNHIITTSIEHASILKTCGHLEMMGYEVTYLCVDDQGFVQPEALKEAISEKTILISIAQVNNEIGTIQPIGKLLEVSEGIAFHTDAVQGFLKTDFDVQKVPVSLASFSGHKFHAPKGIGFAYVRKGTLLEPLIHGGQQEMGIRAGTENVPYIIGLGKAIERIGKDDVIRMKKLQSFLISTLSQKDGVIINGPQDLNDRVCTNVNLSCEAFEGEFILKALSCHGIYVSTGSACHSKYARISHVLQSIGCSPRYIHGNIRLGLSKYTTQNDLEEFLDRFEAILSRRSPFRLYSCE